MRRNPTSRKVKLRHLATRTLVTLVSRKERMPGLAHSHNSVMPKASSIREHMWAFHGYERSVVFATPNNWESSYSDDDLLSIHSILHVDS